MSRRVALGTASLLAPAAAGARSDSKFDDPLAVEVKSPRPLTYEVDFTDPPTLVPRTTSGAFRLLKDIVGCDALVIGEHRGSARDHQLESELLDRMIKYRGADRIAIGLDAVEQPFQKALDAYIMRAEADDKVAERTLATATEWDKRSTMPNVTSTFAAALPVLRLARAKGVPLVALGAPSEALFKVQRGGLDALSTEERLDCIGDPTGFVEAAQSESFRLYADRVLLRRYDKTLAPLAASDENVPSKANFAATVVLQDEACATAATRYLQEHNERFLVALVRQDHATYYHGVPARLERLGRVFVRPMAPEGTATPDGRAAAAPAEAQALSSEEAPGFFDSVQRKLSGEETPFTVKSMLLNPSAQDSQSGNRALRLTLAYADKLVIANPLANYLWFSSSPKVNLLTRMMDPVSYGMFKRKRGLFGLGGTDLLRIY